MIALVILSAVFLFFYNFGVKTNKAEGFGNFLNLTVVLGGSTLISWLVCLISGNVVTMDMLPFAAAFAVMSIVSIVSTYSAYAIGSVAGTALFSNAGLVIVIIFSVIFFKEELSAFKIIGIVGVFISFVFLSLPEKSDGGKARTKAFWLFFCVVVLLMSSGGAIVGKIRQKSVGGQDPFAYMALCFTFSFVLCAMTYACSLIRRRSLKNDFKNLQTCIPSLAFQMIGNSGANLLVTFLSSNVDAAILYPISMGGGLVLTVLAGFTFFKEKKTFVNLTGIVIGVTSMILLGI